MFLSEFGRVKYVSSFLTKGTKKAIAYVFGILVFSLIFEFLYPREIEASNFKLMIQLTTVCIGILFPISINIAFMASNQISSSARFLIERTVPTIISVMRSLPSYESKTAKLSQQTLKKDLEKIILEIKDEILDIYSKFIKATKEFRDLIFLELICVVPFFTQIFFIYPMLEVL